MSSKTDQLRAMREARWVARQQVLSSPPQPALASVAVSATAVVEAPPVDRVIGFAPQASIAVLEPVSLDRPDVPAGRPIGAYRDSDLVDLVAWLAAHGRAGSVGQAVDEVMLELGFQRRGKVIRGRVEAAWTAVNAAGTQ